MRAQLGLLLVLLCMCAPTMAQDLARPAAAVRVPLDGTAVTLPTVDAGARAQVRLSGVFRSSIDGRQYDALYRTDSSGQFTDAHGLLVIEPSGVQAVSQDEAAHAYVFAVPGDEGQAPVSFTVRLDTNKLVREFIQAPSEVRGSLSGSLRAELLVAPPARAIPAAAAILVIPVALIVLVVYFAMHGSRRARAMAFADVLQQRSRIREKCQAALEEIGSGDGLFAELRQRVRALREGAEEVCEHVLLFRRSRVRFDAESVRREMDSLRRRADSAGAPELAERHLAEIAAKEQTLQSLQGNQDREADYMLRLASVETAIDNLRLKLPELRVRLAETEADTAAVLEMDRELQLLHKVIQEMREQLPAGTAAGVL